MIRDWLLTIGSALELAYAHIQEDMDECDHHGRDDEAHMHLESLHLITQARTGLRHIREELGIGDAETKA